MTFASDVKKYADKMQLDADKVLRASVLRVFSETISATPVDAEGHKVKGVLIGGGTARNSWFTELNGTPQGLRRPPDRTGNAAMGEMMEAANRMKFGDYIYIINRTPYIHKLEFGGYPNPAKKGRKTVGGYSRQAPKGMMRLAIRRAKANIKRLIKGMT
jgi:hypothetical protein